MKDFGGLREAGQWQQAPASPSLADPKVLIWENELIVWRDFRISENDSIGKVKVSIDYQVCDEKKCLPPDTVSLEAKLID